MLRKKARLFGGQEKFYHASNFQHVRPMFELAWMPFLAALSTPLRESDDLTMIQKSLQGFRAAIHIAGLFDMDLERNAFITTLSKSTMLNNFAEMKPKNVEVIKSLLDIGISEGNNLDKAWYDVLSCVSRIERYQSSPSVAWLEADGKKNRRQSTYVSSYNSFQNSNSTVIDKDGHGRSTSRTQNVQFCLAINDNVAVVIC